MPVFIYLLLILSQKVAASPLSFFLFRQKLFVVVDDVVVVDVDVAVVDTRR